MAGDGRGEEVLGILYGALERRGAEGARAVWSVLRFEGGALRTSRRGLRAAPLLLLLISRASPAQDPTPLRLGTTTTVEQSGALALLDSLWHDPLVTAVGPSGQILRSAAEGDLDVVVTHAPALEAKWLAGRTLLHCPFVASRFAIVGPADDPAGVSRAGDAPGALTRIARHRSIFVSRGDSSGTHMKELALWRAAGVEARGASWYLESGAGQAATLEIADQREGYALADLPTFARVQGVALRVLFTRDSSLENPYTLYVIRTPALHPAARSFALFAMGPWRARLLAIRLADGSPAFAPRGGACTEEGPPALGNELLGRWEYRSPRPAGGLAPGAGLIVALVIDSAAGSEFFGRITRWFAGDVGVSITHFGRISGRIEGRTASFAIPFASVTVPIDVEARLEGDSLFITADHRGDGPGPFAAPGGRLVRVQTEPR